MKRMSRFLLAALVCLAAAATGHAEEFLMTSDGVSNFNNPRAQALGHTVTARSLSQIVNSNDLDSFDVVWTNPSPPDYNLLRQGCANGGKLEQYAANGGTLVLHVVGNAGNQADVAPGGVDFNRSILHDEEIIAEPQHPYITGAGYGGAQLNEAMFVDWFNTDHGWLEQLVNGSTVVVRNVDGPTWAEYPWGRGIVIVTCMTYGWGTNGARAEPLDNMIKYAAFAQGGGVCRYTVKKSKAKGGCGTCPERGSEIATDTRCQDVGECRKKIKTTINCPDGPGACKIKGKRSSCE